jgi:hypothetical protein
MDEGYQILDTGCWILDAGYLILDIETLQVPFIKTAPEKWDLKHSIPLPVSCIKYPASTLIKVQGILNLIKPASIRHRVSSIQPSNNICFIDSEKIYLDTFEYTYHFIKKTKTTVL